MQTPLFATFYTDDSYRTLACRLERCCRVFGLRFVAVTGRDHGSWRQNCNQKPRLLESLRAQVSGPIVWLDADCVIHRPPVLFHGGPRGDAILWRGGRDGDKPYVGSQVMFWSDTPTARAMIAEWAERSRGRPDSLADPLLKEVCDAWAGRADIERLPDTYRAIYWAPEPGLAQAEIVISCNERASLAADARTKRARKRVLPFVLPHGAALEGDS